MNLPKAYSKYGADMGRREQHADNKAEPIKLRLARVPLDAGGYDSGGAYWGVGQPLYCAWDEETELQIFFRASNREAAKRVARETYPNARLYR